MNNRYIFKGKRKDNGEWVEGYLIQGNRTYIVTIEAINYMVVSTSYMASIELVEVIPETVGQCTGLKDKNGKWIFEGNILRLNDDGEVSNYEVYWNDDEAGWCIKIEDSFVTMDCWGETRGSFEIIGNIHDNPELLEV